MILGLLTEALKGAAEEVKAGPTVSEKVRRACALSTTFVWEVLKMTTAVPYAYHANSLWKNPEKQQDRWRFNLLRDVRYGPAARNSLDVYTPVTCDSNSSLPVLMFIHGGVWSSGDKSLYSPIGATLAHHGVVALLVQYTLFPQVLAKEQVKEVSQALTWAFDNIKQYGGNPSKINVMGHSSGGHLCGMLLWERARRALCFRKGSSLPVNEDKRQPRSYLGLSGVFNMFDHYKFECGRGVGALSCLKPSMNGIKGFPSMSPGLLFGSLLALKNNEELEGTSGYSSGSDLSNVATENMDWSKWAAEQPPFVFFASDNDKIVPPLTSINLHKVLQDLGCKSGVTLLENLAHDDFACWVKGIRGNENPLAKILLRDVLDIVNEEVKIDSYLHAKVGVKDILN